jgi:hypothetical protein
MDLMSASSAASAAFVPEGVLETGDRFELLAGDAGLLLPETLAVNQVPVEVIEDESGRSLDFTLQPEEGYLLLPEAVRSHGKRT